MVCHACKIGIHTGEQFWLTVMVHGRQWGKTNTPAVCKGGTWCDCQHRRTDANSPVR
jgi:hypothetical protein